MTASPRREGITRSGEGVVVRAPRRWLGLEGLVPAGILVPDLAMGGYLAGTRPGAHLYNVAHATLLPAVMLGIGYWQADRLVTALALIWLAQIGLDRLLGMGLKYDDRFAHTHLGDQADRRQVTRPWPGD
jgi:hypothetical protein